MRKDEFLQTLRRALNGNVPPRVVEENVRYYDGYISDEVRKGRSEEEVIEEIGDPRLIARTIEDTTDGAGEGEFVDDDTSAYSRSSDRGYGTYDSDRTGSTQRHSMHYIDLSKWYWRILAVVIVAAVIYLVFMVIGGVLTLIAPLIGPLFLIWLIVTIFRNFKQS